MRKPALNFSIDILAFIFFILLASTGFLMYWILPPGSGQMGIWGMNRHAWGEIHFWFAVIFLVLIGIHFYLHWDWIKNMTVGKKRTENKSRLRTVVTILGVLILLLLALSPFLSPVEIIR